MAEAAVDGTHYSVAINDPKCRWKSDRLRNDPRLQILTNRAVSWSFWRAGWDDGL